MLIAVFSSFLSSLLEAREINAVENKVVYGKMEYLS